MSRLRDAIEEVMAANGGSLNTYTVLSPQRDPYRLDTPTGHRNGRWLAEQMQRLGLTVRRIHLRGLHYALVASGDAAKPTACRT